MMKLILGLIVVGCICVIILFAIDNQMPINGIPLQNNGSGMVYKTFYIEGMPCMLIGREGPTGNAFDYDGVTCDWSKWDG